MRFRRGAWLVFVALAWPCAADITPTVQPDQGLAALEQAYLDIGRDLTILSFAAHPDDEDLETLAYYRKKFGLHAISLLATRGEGGQNEIGSEQYKELGILRTRETEAADALIGSEVHFLNFEDFGYSKSVDETFQRWGGRDAVVARLVEALRILRPDIVITNHGILRDHGHHQACGIAIQEAVDKAADPDYTAGGAPAFQVKKLYFRLPLEKDTAMFAASMPASAVEDVPVNVGEYDPLRGATYTEIALAALRLHRSQGVWPAQFEWRAPKFNRFRLIKSAESAEARETELTDGLKPLHFPPCAALADGEEGVAPYPTVEQLIEGYGQEVSRLASTDSKDVATIFTLGQRLDRISRLLALKSHIDVRAEAQAGSLAPGETEPIRVEVFNGGSSPVHVSSISVSSGWIPLLKAEPPTEPIGALLPGQRKEALIKIDIPNPPGQTQDVATRPETVVWYTKTRTIPLFNVRATVNLGESFSRDAVFQTPPVALDPDLRPAIEIEADPPDVPAMARAGGSTEVVLHVRNNSSKPVPGVRVGFTDPFTGQERLSRASELASGGAVATADSLMAYPAESTPAGVYPIQVGPRFEKGLPEGMDPPSTITVRIHVLGAKVAPDLTVGLVKTYDDTLKEALKTLGARFEILGPSEVRRGDLRRFATILLDVRAYYARPDVRLYNDRLLQYVRDGGNLIVFYNKSYEWNREDGGAYSPFVIQLGRERVTFEGAPVNILEPGHPLFKSPNPVTPADFDGWIQERALYLPLTYDTRFKELLECHDPGEPEQRGALLLAKDGWGTYIYTALAWTRQLRDFHPGAYKLFANMISLPKVQSSESP